MTPPRPPPSTPPSVFSRLLILHVSYVSISLIVEVIWQRLVGEHMMPHPAPPPRKSVSNTRRDADAGTDAQAETDKTGTAVGRQTRHWEEGGETWRKERDLVARNGDDAERGARDIVALL